MIRTVVAIESEKLSGAVCHALDKSGIIVRYRCTRGSDAIRAIKKMGGGVVITTPHLPDMHYTQLSENLDEQAYILILGKETDLEDCRGQNVFKLGLPVASNLLISEIDKLLQCDEKKAKEKIPQRTQNEIELIQKAKEEIMKIHHLNENAAHRYLQKYSMDASVPMAEAAKRLIQVYGKE